MKTRLQSTARKTSRCILTGRIAAACAAAVLGSQSAQAAAGTWIGTTVGPFNWSDTTQWNGGIVADGAGFTAFYNGITTGGVTVTTTLDTARTIGGITRSSTGVTGSWTITSATNALTLDNGASNSTIANNINGASVLTVDTDLVLNSNLVVSANGNNGAGIVFGATAGVHTITGAKNITVASSSGFGNGAITINDNITTTGAITNSITGTGSPGAVTINGVIGSGVTGVTANSTGGSNLTLTGANLFTSATTVGTAGSVARGGTLTVSGVNGTINQSSSYTVNGVLSQLNLDYAGVANGAVDRVGNVAITLNLGGELKMTGNTTAATSSSESFGTLTLGLGNGIVTITNGGSGASTDTLTASGFDRGSSFATALIRGSNMGTATNPTSRLILTSQLGLTQIGTNTSATGINTGTVKNLTIVPYLVGATSATGVGSNFVTYDTTSALRRLGDTEQSLVTAGATDDNVRTAAGANAVIGAKVFNSLLLSSGGTGATPGTVTSSVTGDGSSLTVTSGALANVATSATGNATVSGFSSIIFGTAGANEAVITNTNATAGGDLTISSPIDTSAPGGGLTKAGGGRLILSVSPLYTGQTTVNQGTLQIGTATTGDLGTNTANIVLNGGTLSFARTDAGLTIANNISGPGGVTQNGVGGTTALTGTNSYTGITTVTTGTLNLNNTTPQTAGPLVNNATLNVNGSTSFTTLTMSAGAFTSLLNVNNGGTLTLTGTSIIGQADNAANGTLHILSGGTVSVTSTDFRIANGGTGITAAGTVTLDAGSALTLNATGNTNALNIADGPATTGTLNLDGGTLTTARNISSGNGGGNASQGNVAGGTSTFNFNGGTLKAGGAFSIVASLTRANVRNGGAIFDNNGLVINVPQSLLHSNIGGDNATDGGVTKNGIGTLTLSATNTYTGGTIINDGSLNPTVAGALGSGAVTINSAGTLYQTAGAITYPNDLILAGGTFRVGGGAGKSVGTTGNVTLTADSLISADGSTLGVTLAGTTVDTGGFTLSSFANGNTNTISSQIIGAGGITMTGPASGTTKLTGANTYSGKTTVTGGVLSISTSGNLGDGSATNTVSLNGGTLQDTGAGVSTSRAVALGASGGTVEVTGGNDLTLSGAISGAGNSLTKAGTGTLTLSGAQSYNVLNASLGTTNLSSTLGSGTSTLNASAILNITVSETIAALNIAAGSVVTLGNPPPSAPAELFADAPVFAGGSQAVPEPGTAALLIGGITALLSLRRRRM